MAKFCTKCGKPLSEGEVCNCAFAFATPPANKGYASADRPVSRPVNPNTPPVSGNSMPQGGRPVSQNPRPVNPNTHPMSGTSQPQGGRPVNQNPRPVNPNTPPMGAAPSNPNPSAPGKPVPGVTKSTNKNGKESININVNQVASTAGGLWTAIKNQIGIGDPLINDGDAYEKGKRIVPDCVKPNDSEVPVRQYHIATLRNRILGIPYTKAQGRIQVTNKRVIFRAPGRCIAGRTTLQHEFQIDDIAGIESRREFVFNFWDLVFGFLVLAIGGAISTLITMLITDGGRSEIGAFIFSLIFEGLSIVSFFMIKKRWLLKLLILGAGLVPMSFFGGQIISQEEFFGGLMIFLALFPYALSMLTLFIYSIRPNLAVIIKTKSASEAIDIRRKKENFLATLIGLGGQNEKDDHTGYKEILPEKDAEIAIREIGAMINDIQKYGDHGIAKWKR